MVYIFTQYPNAGWCPYYIFELFTLINRLCNKLLMGELKFKRIAYSINLPNLEILKNPLFQIYFETKKGLGVYLFTIFTHLAILDS